MGVCTYVTALYSINTPDKRDHAGRDARFELLRKLFSLEIKCIAFMDPEYESLFDTSSYPNVRFIFRPLESFLFWKMCTQTPLALPSTRNTVKDTLEFLALMNTKIEFVKEALPYIDTENIAWIDGSIYHIISDENRVKGALEKEYELDTRIRIPGPIQITKQTTPILTLANQIQWKFCGGYFQGKKAAMQDFYEKSFDILVRWIERGHLTWEVNLWVEIEDTYPDYFHWVYGDHNDSMLLVNE